jgi:hypothetical protein
LTDLVRRPGESLGSYLVRAQSMTKAPGYQRRVPDERTALAKLTGDMTTGISDNELEDWYMTLDEKVIPEHEQFKENVAAVLEEPVFLGPPPDFFRGEEIGADGYVPMTFSRFFESDIVPLMMEENLPVGDMKEQIVARLTGEPHNFQDENVKKYTTMVLDNLKEGQSADTFPAMTQEEQDEAYAKYGDKARFYIGQENRDNFGRRKAYGLLQTFADGEHAPPLQGLSSAIMGTAGQMYTNLTDTFFPAPYQDSNDGGDGYENARVATDALGGPLGRIRQANKFYTRATEDPEFVRNPVTGANYANESNLSIAGMGNYAEKSDGHYQHLRNRLLNSYDNTSLYGSLQNMLGLDADAGQIQPPGVMAALQENEQTSNRTTPIVPGGRYVSDTDDVDAAVATQGDAADRFKGYKEFTAGAPDRAYRRTTGMNPTGFQSAVFNLPRELLTDPSTLASTALSAGFSGAARGLRGMAAPLFGNIAEEAVEEAGVGGILGGLLGGKGFFTEPMDVGYVGPYDPQDKALESMDESQRQAYDSVRAAAGAMQQQRSPIGRSLLPQEELPRRGRRPFMTQMPPKGLE